MKPADPCILTINGGSSSIKSALPEVGDSLRGIPDGGIFRFFRSRPDGSWASGHQSQRE
jgi:acetate kinase